jgi:putative ABC transport system substrate-binding protein
VEVILAPSNPQIAAARQATTTVPIVMVWGAAPVELGWVKSLARPGTNVTGALVHTPEMNGKMVELLRESVPGARRIGLLYNPGFPGITPYVRAVEDAARRLGFTLHAVEVRTLAQLLRVLDGIRAAKPQGLLVIVDAVSVEGRQAIFELAARERLPVMYNFRDLVDAGGLMSYAPSLSDGIRRAAHFVDRIFRGARPADLPVEQPTRYELVINLKAARALGLVIPPAVLARADETIGP